LKSVETVVVVNAEHRGAKEILCDDDDDGDDDDGQSGKAKKDKSSLDNFVIS